MSLETLAQSVALVCAIRGETYQVFKFLLP